MKRMVLIPEERLLRYEERDRVGVKILKKQIPCRWK